MIATCKTELRRHTLQCLAAKPLIGHAAHWAACGRGFTSAELGAGEGQNHLSGLTAVPAPDPGPLSGSSLSALLCRDWPAFGLASL